MAELTTYDLETLRLGYYNALFRDLSPGHADEWFVLGQPTPWPKRVASIDRLVRMGFLVPDMDRANTIEAPLVLTPKGECLYGQFVEALENGTLKRS